MEIKTRRTSDAGYAAASLCGVYLVTPNWDDTERLLHVTEQALSGGASLLQYRNKNANQALGLQQARAMQTLCKKFEVPFIINDHIALCMLCDADGIHLGGTDISVAQARQMLGPKKIVGASCYGDLRLATSAKNAGASYVAFGGFYPSLVKQYSVTTKIGIVSEAKSCIDIPIVVIGGMTCSLAAPLVQSGANMVAVISSVYMADDPTAAVRELVALFQ
jgi:thiamine-phosphate pyrophosphorylase